MDTRTKDKPGKNDNHHFPLVKYFMDSDKIIPMAGSWDCNPNPKNVTDDSCSMACGKISTIPTKSCGIM